MLERLGHVLGWTGNVLAVLTLLATVAFVFIAHGNGDPQAMMLSAGIAGCVVALVLFAIGRALRYILAGPKSFG